MCYPVTCATCGKTTWDGCGQHVADVQRAVPAAEWCPGHDLAANAAPQPAAARTGRLSRLFTR